MVNNTDNMTDKERYDLIIKLLGELKEKLIAYEALESVEHDSTGFPRDYAFECAVCGKPMQNRRNGMCPHCEMVFNG